eukprot:SM009620S24938  [mRNA]  locus=s9620:65:435:- [translate_table: standard]
MLRFEAHQQVADNLYQRTDGTLAYFFSKEYLAGLFVDAGFELEECNYCCVRLLNRKKAALMHRVFINGVFCKPVSRT